MLQAKNLSIQQLYNILEREREALEKIKLYTLWPTYPLHKNTRDEAFFIIASMGSLIIGVPLLAIGLAIKNYIAPSTIQKVASYSLMTMGGIALTPEIVLDAYRKGFIAQIVLPKIYDMITQTEKKQTEKIGKINIETGIIFELMRKLEELYPELPTWGQPTSP